MVDEYECPWLLEGASASYTLFSVMFFCLFVPDLCLTSCLHWHLWPKPAVMNGVAYDWNTRHLKVSCHQDITFGMACCELWLRSWSIHTTQQIRFVNSFFDTNVCHIATSSPFVRWSEQCIWKIQSQTGGQGFAGENFRELWSKQRFTKALGFAKEIRSSGGECLPCYTYMIWIYRDQRRSFNLEIHLSLETERDWLDVFTSAVWCVDARRGGC